MVVWQVNYEEAIKMGDALAWQGKWEESVDYFRKALAVDPVAPLPHSSLGAAFVHLGRFAEALEEYRQVLKALPQDVLALSRIADLYSRLGQMEECTRAYVSLGDMHMEQGNYRLAVAAWLRLVSLVPEHQEVRSKLAEALERGGDVEDASGQYAFLAHVASTTDPIRAEQLARKAIELDPDNVDARVLLDTLRTAADMAESIPGEIQGGTGQKLDAEPSSSEGGRGDHYAVGCPLGAARRGLPDMSVTPTSGFGVPEVRSGAALDSSENLVEQGLYFAAVDECYQAISAAPDRLTTQIKLGEILLARGKSREAADKYVSLAGVFLARGSVDEALGMHRRTLDIYPHDFEQRAGFIHLLARAGRASEALEQQVILAENRVQAGQLKLAVAEFREAIRMSPADVRTHLLFARMLWEKGRSGDALREYEEVAARDPNNVEALLKLSIANRLSGDIGEAHKSASRLIDLVRSNAAEANYALLEYQSLAERYSDIADFSAWAGLLLFNLGNVVGAASNLERALQGASDVEAVACVLCQCYLAQGMHDAAVSLLPEACASRAAALKAVFYREADRLVREGYWNDAISLLEKLRREEPRDESVFVKLAEAHYRQGDVSGAVREFDSIGRICLERGLSSKAIGVFQIMKQISPQATLPYVRMAELLLQEGRKEKALEEFRALARLQIRHQNVGDGIATMKRIVELDSGEPNDYVSLGDAMLSQKQYADAAAIFRRLLELEPDNAFARSRLTAIDKAADGRDQ